MRLRILRGIKLRTADALFCVPRSVLMLGLISILTASAAASPLPPASPAAKDEIERAVRVAGARDGQEASARQFFQAFVAVLARVKQHELAAYVVGAINLRPDFSSRIVTVAIKTAARQWEAKQGALCEITRQIIGAAITANPAAVVSIVRAAVEASPESRQCVVAAAIAAMPSKEAEIQTAAQPRGGSFAFLTLSDLDDTGFSVTSISINPANLSDLRGNADVNSPEQAPSH
jgi:hypothetical protein